MRKPLNNKLLMFWAVLNVLDKFKLLWSGIAGFVTVQKDFRGATDKLQKTATAAGTKTKEITKNKNSSVKNFIVHLFRATSILAVHATNTGNTALQNQTDYTESELEDMRPAELLGLSDLVLENLTANKTELVNLGLTEEDITIIADFIDNFETITSSPRTTITSRKAAGAQLRPQFAAASFILKEKLDKLMEQFRLTQPEFYNEYWNARDTVKYGTRHEEEGKDEEKIEETSEEKKES